MARYIDAEKLKGLLRPDDWETPDERWRPESEFGKLVDAMPTEDVTPIVKAHWETIDGECRCSNCKAILEEYMSEWVNFRYCYHCGARMERE